MAQTGNTPERKEFPTCGTVFIGIWLLLFAVLSVIGFYVAFFTGSLKISSLVNLWSYPEFKESLITMFASGVGSSITSILAYLKHASESKDFDRAYIPWYVARPVMGMLLGLVFYFTLKGGLFVLTLQNSASQPDEIINLWSLSAAGALVGLFSKNAIEKLRELFNILFKTRDDMKNELLKRLPKELKDKVEPYLEGADTKKEGHPS